VHFLLFTILLCFDANIKSKLEEKQNFNKNFLFILTINKKIHRNFRVFVKNFQWFSPRFSSYAHFIIYLFLFAIHFP